MNYKSKITILQEGSQIYLFDPIKDCPTGSLAAAEIAKYLKAVLNIDVKTISNKKDGCRVVFEKINDDALGTEGFEISVTADAITIRVNSKTGFLRGAYYFIEKFLGVRFLSPDAEFVPKLSSLVCPEETIREIPAIASRGTTPYLMNTFSLERFMDYIDWMGKNRLNYLGFGYLDDMEKLTALRPELVKRGIRLSVGGHILEPMLYGNWKIDACRTYEERDKIAEKLLLKHPEWHCLVKGKRAVCKDHYAHICLSSHGAVSRVKENILIFLREYREFIDDFSFCLNDSLAAFCECERCKKHKVAELAQNFYNHIAEAISEEFPDLPIHFCVYSDYIFPDLNVKPVKNISFELAFWGQDYRMGLTGASEKNGRGKKLYELWGKLAKEGKGNNELFAFQYYCYSRYSPGPRLSCLFDDARFYREHGITGCYDNLGQAAALGEKFPRVLTHYFMARALWNPDLDSLATAVETFKPVFGKNTQAVLACLKLWDAMDADILTEPIWWRWRQYPLDLLDDAMKTADLDLARLREAGNILESIPEETCSRLSASIIAEWLDFTAKIINKVEQVKEQKLLLRDLIQQLESGKELTDTVFISKLKTRYADMFKSTQEAAFKFDKDGCALLSRTFMLPEDLAVLVASFGKGRERALANVCYNSLYDWGGCRHARDFGISCGDCDIIACPGFLDGPGMKRYTVRETPVPAPEIKENRWIRAG